MSDLDTLDERLRTVERTLTGDDFDLLEVRDAADVHARFESIETRLDTIESRLADLDASSQALRGYVGNVRAVNREVERRADAAIAAVESLEEETVTDPTPIYPQPERPPAIQSTREAEQMTITEHTSGLRERLREVL